MSKLSEIIDAATTESVSTADLLRMTKVLAARMKTPPLGDWVHNELGGYPKDAQLPEYRGPFAVQVVSDWLGPFNSGMKNMPLPPLSVPKGLREAGAFQVEFREPVSELERLAQAENVLTYSWGADVVAILNGEVSRGEIPEIVPMMGLVSAHRQVSPARIKAVLDNVRTRVLDLALELEQVAPEAGDPGSSPPDPNTVNNIVNTYIYGYGNTVAVGSSGAAQAVKVNDLQSLLTAVSALGLAPEDVTELRQAIAGDAADEETPPGKPGSRVARFLGKVTVGGLKNAGQAGVQEGAKMLGEWIRAYYGIG